jgi:hypothetical protein
MWDAERWVKTRLGETKVTTDGKAITVYDTTRIPYTFGEIVGNVWATARTGDYILHNGYGQFRILNKAQFDYWYEEKE